MKCSECYETQVIDQDGTEVPCPYCLDRPMMLLDGWGVMTTYEARTQLRPGDRVWAWATGKVRLVEVVAAPGPRGTKTTVTFMQDNGVERELKTAEVYTPRLGDRLTPSPCWVRYHRRTETLVMGDRELARRFEDTPFRRGEGIETLHARRSLERLVWLARQLRPYWTRTARETFARQGL